MTGLATALAASAGRGASGCLLVALTVLSGQLSIGWCNDLVDVQRDRAAERMDKPLAQGVISRRAVAVGCAAAVAACVPLSFTHGSRAGVVHLLVVAGGWAYNLGLKKTLLSWVAYATSFGLLGAFIPLGLPDREWPQPWVIAAGALLGVGVHFLNVVPDVADDVVAGVRGLPQRLGARRAQVLGALLMAVAAVTITFGPDEAVPTWAYPGLALALLFAGLSSVLGAAAPSRSRAPFLLALATAAVAILLLVARGSALT